MTVTPDRRDQPIFFLAFDHRGAFARAIFDAAEASELTPAREQVMREMKALIFDSVVRVAETTGLPYGRPGILVDELYGAEPARAALQRGIAVAMPVEEPDRDVFALTYGERFGEHIEAFDADFAKALVRYNVDGSAEDNAVQRARLATLSGWLRERGRKFLFELVVAPTPAQLAAAGGDARRFELEQRPALMQRAIAELQDAGVDPELWKLEGIDAIADAEAVVAQARAGDRRDVACTVLGAGAEQEQVDRWLQTAARVEGFEGFAIGRSIWRDPVREYLAGRIAREQAVEQIANGYRRFVDVSHSHSPSVA